MEGTLVVSAAAQHRTAFALECAVCLPSDEDASIAKEIRRLFPEDESTLIGCSQSNATDESAIKNGSPRPVPEFRLTTVKQPIG
ncbi:hypothetical protein DAPPUDRAFT_256897 [Daphnia pulex]|uniref:Uncharacterized protein n=1 Tax=Daphnia pulex TaxID=6669 RepID=E9HCC7_DAPPU|nr:hypothetical protein DAPPUDRAFT_256897 [Daphnia pulex]|eukprot:EFX70633.1 hypothetical protein DAPPUDRAFT_256897 [Daphnia pulex]